MSRQENTEGPEDIVRHYRFHRQIFENKKKILPIERLRVSTYYKNHKRLFDKLYFICTKYKIDYREYVKFCVLENGCMDPYCLADVQSFAKFGHYIDRINKYRKIYNYYVKSANNVADECIRLGYRSSSEYIGHLVSDNELGYKYITGNISKYYIATLGNIDEIFKRMDLQNRTELGIIASVSGELNNDVQTAFKMFEKSEAHTISFTDSLINKKQKQIENQ